MAEFVYTAAQTVAAGSNVILNNKYSLTRGNIFHDNESGVITLRPVINNPVCQQFGQYECIFVANIAIPEGGEVGEISIGFAQAGEVEQSTVARFTPAAVNEFGNVVCLFTTRIPAACGCANIAIENNSDQPIVVQEANLSVKRTS